MSNLSDKHEKFCQNYIINGFNSIQAYLSVYKTTYESAEASSSRLLNNVRIKERLDELKKETQEYYKITKEELLNDLKDIKDRNKGLRDQTAMKAIEIISKMSGYDAPIKQDITISEEPPLFSDDDLVE